ncbi:MAG: hypothetical protein Q8O05_07225 [Chloroflexota bacterium]|nr:hypothetical protein [Chloroflexota bacterium]
MKITIDTALGGAGFVFFAYILVLVVSVIVAGMISLMCRLIHKKGAEAGPAEK